MQEWERVDSIKTLKREIEMLKSKKSKLYENAWKINYNTQRGQKQGEKLQQDINDIDNEISNCYEELGRLKQIKGENEDDRKTSIQVRVKTRNQLIELDKGHYDDAIQFLLDAHEKESRGKLKIKKRGEK